MCNIIVLTGAGISAESGVPTFRGTDGLWNRPEAVFLTKKSLLTNLVETCKFYDKRREEILTKEPNLAHKILVELENNKNHNVTIITQNIDNLHEKAGSKNVLHMHGEITKLRSFSDEDKIVECYGNQTDYSYRPHVVFFDECVLHLDDIFPILKTCELYIAIGTSDNVSPACSFVNMVPKKAKKIQINLERTEFSGCYNEIHLGKCTNLLPKILLEHQLL